MRASVTPIVDVIQVLTESVDGRKYWNKLKQRLKEEGSETVTNCHQLKTRLKQEGSELATNCSQLKMPAADGKIMYLNITKAL